MEKNILWRVNSVWMFSNDIYGDGTGLKNGPIFKKSLQENDLEVRENLYFSFFSQALQPPLKDLLVFGP